MAKRTPHKTDGRGRIGRWFASRSWTPWPFQVQAWDAYQRGESGLIQVATGAGKTYAAYLGPLAGLIDERLEGPVQGLRVLYVTPLRAVSRDIELALRAPIEELDLDLDVESRTGDTGAAARARQRTRLPHVLVTTPESLTLLLTREDSRGLFASLRAVIVDEWHELLSSKRGTQVELALARLRGFSPSVCTWALSATLPNADEAARAVCGTSSTPRIIHADMDRPVLIDSILPEREGRLPWAGHLGMTMLPRVVEALDPASATIVFTNTRSQAERWYHAILIARPEWEGVMALHHGSLDRDDREAVEQGLKSGRVRIVVATSSLDLGVDFDPIERVLQIGSPKGISRLVQRAGRSSHRPRTPCRVTCVPTHALELIEIAAARRALAAHDLEPRRPLDKPLDVLVQHLVTCALGGGFEREDLLREVRSAWSFRGLADAEFDWALALVTHGGETLHAYPDFHRVTLDDEVYRVTAPRIARLHRLNVGTITADATLDIRFRSGKSLGRIEESFVAGLREGQKFVFAGRVLRFESLRDTTAIVSPASGSTSYTPTWFGTKLPISESLAQAIRATLEHAGNGNLDTPELLAARGFIEVQRRDSRIPSSAEALAEVCTTSEGTHLFLFPFEGRLVHAGLAAILALRLSRLRPATFAVACNDYGLEILSPEPFPFESALGPELFTTTTLAADAAESANTSLLAKLQFREIARIAGLVIQTFPGAPKTGRQLQAGASLLFDVLSEFDPKSPLLEQARREVVQRHYEQSRLARTLTRLAAGELRIVRLARPSPLSFPLLIERQSARLSSESVLERVQRMRTQWETACPTLPSSPSSTAPPAVFDLGPLPAPRQGTPRTRRAFSRRPRG